MAARLLRPIARIQELDFISGLHEPDLSGQVGAYVIAAVEEQRDASKSPIGRECDDEGRDAPAGHEQPGDRANAAAGREHSVHKTSLSRPAAGVVDAAFPRKRPPWLALRSGSSYSYAPKRGGQTRISLQQQQAFAA